MILTLYTLIKNLKSLETIVNCELSKVVGWLIANKLSLNIKKTNYIIFHPYQKRIVFDIRIKVYDSRTKTFFDLEGKDHVKYLGVIIDQHLSWKHHINYIALKISRNIGIISRLRHSSLARNLLWFRVHLYEHFRGLLQTYSPP